MTFSDFLIDAKAQSYDQAGFVGLLHYDPTVVFAHYEYDDMEGAVAYIVNTTLRLNDRRAKVYAQGCRK